VWEASATTSIDVKPTMYDCHNYFITAIKDNLHIDKGLFVKAIKAISSNNSDIDRAITLSYVEHSRTDACEQRSRTSEQQCVWAGLCNLACVKLDMEG
jgi:hypothetical protein